MNGIEYEKACARFLSHHGYRRIRMTPATGDQGIDILAERGHELYGFQCKYYSHPVGNKAVQQAYAGKKYYACDHCGVITNSTFTPAAVELAEAADVILMDEVTPALISLSSYILNAACFLLCCIGISEISEVGRSGANGTDNIAAFHAITMLLAAAVSPFSENRYYAALSACILHAMSLASAFAFMTLYISMSFLLITALSAAVAVSVGIRLIRMIRVRTDKYTEDMTKQLTEEYQDTLNGTGICFGRILTRDLHTELELLHASHTPEGISEFVYRSKDDVSDLLLTVEAVLNHTAFQQGIDESYELTPLKENIFRARISIRDTDS